MSIYRCSALYGIKGTKKEDKVSATIVVDTEAVGFESLLRVLVANAGRLLIGGALSWNKNKDGTHKAARADIDGKVFETWEAFEAACGHKGDTDREAKRLARVEESLAATVGTMTEEQKARLRALLG